MRRSTAAARLSLQRGPALPLVPRSGSGSESRPLSRFVLGARRVSAPALPDLVHVFVDVAPDLAGQARNGLELLTTRLQKPLRGPEMREQQALAGRPDAGQLVEHRPGHRAVAATTMELDRKAMRLVARPLQQLQRRRVVRHHERGAAPGQEDLLDPLGEADHRRPEVAERRQRLEPRRQLALAAVDDYYGLQRREARVVRALVRPALPLRYVL